MLNNIVRKKDSVHNKLLFTEYLLNFSLLAMLREAVYEGLDSMSVVSKNVVYLSVFS